MAAPVTLAREIGRTLSGALSVVLEGLRLLAGHWPTLVSVLLLGAACRELALWASLVSSRTSPVLSVVIVSLAPLASVIALIVALRVVLPSLHHVTDGAVGRHRGLGLVASALVPFLALYASQGYLSEDTHRYLNEVAADVDRTTNPYVEAYDGRVWTDGPLWQVLTLVMLALLLRWGLDRFRLAERNVGFGFLAGWAEALWLVTLAKTLGGWWSTAWGWVKGRQGVAWLVDAWQWVVAHLGPLGQPADRAVSWLLDVLGSFDTLVVVPMAWLTVGAVVYGRELRTAGQEDLRHMGSQVLATVDEAGRARAAAERARAAAERARARARVVTDRRVLPTWLRGWLGDWLVGPVTSVGGRFSALGRGLLTLLRAGLVPMVTLCLVLVLARHVGLLAAVGLRAVLGPQDVGTAVAFSPVPGMLFSLTSTILTVVLVAAAVDRFLVQPAEEQAAQEQAAAGGAEPASGATAPTP